MWWLNLLDQALLEPIIRWRFPEPPDRRIHAALLHGGQGEIRLLCLSGAFCIDARSNWAGWIRTLRHSFPSADIVMLNGFYFYWQTEAAVIRQVIDVGKRVLADRKPTYVIGFSFGGLLGKCMVAGPEVHNVRAIVTMATEHRGHLPRIAEMRDVSLGVPLDVDVPLYTFGGLFDPIVWPWTTYTDRSIHSMLPARHFDFIRSSDTRQRVMQVLYKIIERHQGR